LGDLAKQHGEADPNSMPDRKSIVFGSEDARPGSNNQFSAWSLPRAEQRNFRIPWSDCSARLA
jgi:hypothetical protein